MLSDGNCCVGSQIKVPVIVVGCKLDLRDDRQPSLEQVMAPLMHEFREIETCIECSSIKQIQVFEPILDYFLIDISTFNNDSKAL